MKQAHKHRRFAGLLALFLMLVLGSCGQEPASGTPTASPTPAQTSSVTPEPTENTPSDRTSVRLAMLQGPTGLGAVKLLADNDAGSTQNDYQTEIAAQPDQLTVKLINGELDIAALPTNVAANLYHKTDGGIRLLALNTLGVLYILENGDSVHSMADLAGQTLYATGQGANPEYVLHYLLRQNGLEPDRDVTIEWRTGEEVAALLASGEITLAMLPIPAATAAQMQNTDVRTALDLTDVWNASGAGGTLTMGCVVARTQFAAEHPEAVDAFLAEYRASIQYVQEQPDKAAEWAAQYGITPSAAVAQRAIPQANLVCLTGIDLLSIQDYYEVLYRADPNAIGGSIPDGAFYYGAA